MSKSQRPASPAEQLDRLSRKHAELDARVAELDGKHVLSAEEEQELRKLKKTKLLMKDAMTSIDE